MNFFWFRCLLALCPLESNIHVCYINSAFFPYKKLIQRFPNFKKSDDLIFFYEKKLSDNLSNNKVNIIDLLSKYHHGYKGRINNILYYDNNNTVYGDIMCNTIGYIKEFNTNIFNYLEHDFEIFNFKNFVSNVNYINYSEITINDIDNMIINIRINDFDKNIKKIIYNINNYLSNKNIKFGGRKKKYKILN